MLRPMLLAVGVGCGQGWATAGSAGEAGSPSAGPLRGQALFEGRVDLSGRIRGHVDPLPTPALRCANCHARTQGDRGQVPPGPFGNTQAFGPVLDAAWLTGQRPRRGAPASAYDARALCTALREGLDPQQVRMSRNMPLYEISTADCQALWSYLAGAERR